MTTAQVVEMSKHTSKFQLDLENMDMFKRVLKNSKVFYGQTNYKYNYITRSTLLVVNIYYCFDSHCLIK